NLIQQARKDAVSTEMLLKAGLMIRKSDSAQYDRFRGRFMIPIISVYKKVLGFGGRIIQQDENQPKYINSPETAIYQKSYILFGLYQSRQAIRDQDQAIFVEGYTDLISLFQAGIHNVVATSGTALTPFQARLIKRYTENVFLLYDADTAGSLAAIRGADIFLDEGLEVNIVTLPAGTDPDSFVRDYGVSDFKKLLQQPSSLIRFKINILLKKYDRSSSQGMTQIINELLSSIARIKNSIKQNLAVKEVAEYFSLEERALLQQMQTLRRSPYAQPFSREPKSSPTKPPTKTKSKYEIAEEDLLRLVFSDSKWLPEIFEYLKLDDFLDKDYRQILSHLLSIYDQDQNFDQASVMKSVSHPDLSAKISSIVNRTVAESIDRLKLFEDNVVTLKKRHLENRLHNLEQQIKSAQEKETETDTYVKQHQRCQQELKAVEDRLFFKKDF
ncbi:MAG: toprim domain-containing protein, partial [bacterium]|nr:toprim domain-containing protein [bacterium]